MINGVIDSHVLHILRAPNFVVVPLAFCQMVLHCIYRHKRSQRVENAKVDTSEQLEWITENMKEDITGDYTNKQSPALMKISKSLYHNNRYIVYITIENMHAFPILSRDSRYVWLLNYVK